MNVTTSTPEGPDFLGISTHRSLMEGLPPTYNFNANRVSLRPGESHPTMKNTVLVGLTPVAPQGDTAFRKGDGRKPRNVDRKRSKETLADKRRAAARVAA